MILLAPPSQWEAMYSGCFLGCTWGKICFNVNAPPGAGAVSLLNKCRTYFIGDFFTADSEDCVPV